MPERTHAPQAGDITQPPGSGRRWDRNVRWIRSAALGSGGPAARAPIVDEVREPPLEPPGRRAVLVILHDVLHGVPRSRGEVRNRLARWALTRRDRLTD